MALQFEEILEQLGNAGKAGLVDTYQLWRQGFISRATFIELATDYLELATLQATHYGAVSYAEVSALFKDAVPEYSAALAVTRPAGQPKQQLAKALATILDDSEQSEEDTVTRLERLGMAVPVDAAQGSYQQELQSDNSATGWTRGLDASACELCHHWHRSGRAWPKDHPMPTHVGCKCQQVPLFDDVPRKDTRYLADKRHRDFIDSLNPEELAYYEWAKSVRDKYAEALRSGNKYVDIESLPRPPAGVSPIIPPPNPKLTLRGIGA